MAEKTKSDAWKGTHAVENGGQGQDDGGADPNGAISGDDDVPGVDLGGENFANEPVLFEPPDDVALPLPIDAHEIAVKEKRGKGRPKGSKNKRTNEVSQYLIAMGYRDPLEALAAIYSTPAEVLAKKLKLKVGDTLRIQVQAAIGALPYHHAKKTPDEAPPPNQLPLMMIGEMNVTQVNQLGGMSAGIDPKAKTVENQTVSADDDVRLPDD